MKVLKNAKFSDNVKINDTNTNIYFKAYDDGVLQKLSANNCKFKVKNETGYLTTISDVDIDDKGVIYFKSKQLKDLPVGNYFLELWLENNDEVAIFPDEGFCEIRINENATIVTGTSIPSLSLGEYEERLQKYVDNGISDVRGTADIAKSIASNANDIANNAISKATSNSELISQLSNSLAFWDNTKEIGYDSTNIDFNNLQAGIYSVIGWYSNVMEFPNFPTVMNNKEFMMFVYRTTTGNVTLQMIINADLQFYIRSLSPGGVENTSWKQVQIIS